MPLGDDDLDEKVSAMVEERLAVQLRDHQAAMQAMEARLNQFEEEKRESQQRRQRQDVVKNLRLSVLQSSPLPTTPGVPFNTQRQTSFERRLTAAETLQTPHTPPASSPPTAQQANTVTSLPSTGDKWEVDDHGWETLLKKKKEPVPFVGDPSRDKQGVRVWVQSVDNYLNMFLSDKQGRRLDWVIQTTEGAAQQWLINQRDMSRHLLAAGSLDREVEWVEIKPQFIAYFEGADHRLTWTAEMNALRLGKGKCKDLPQFNAEFDRLRILLAPSSNSGNIEMDEMWGDRYGYLIQVSDDDLYKAVITLGLPKALSDWKLKSSVAMISLAVLRKSGGYGGGQQSGGQRWQNRGNGQGSSHSKSTVGVNRIAAGEDDDDSRSASEREEGEQESAAVQNLNTGATRQKYRLSQVERRQLSSARRCFNCYGKDHIKANCKKEIPNRAPAPAELNA
jgi:hypothetical protein